MAGYEPVEAAGLDLTPVSDQHLSCGSAGSYSILQKEIAQQLLENKIDALGSGTPDRLAHRLPDPSAKRHRSASQTLGGIAGRTVDVIPILVKYDNNSAGCRGGLSRETKIHRGCVNSTLDLQGSGLPDFVKSRSYNYFAVFNS